MNRHRSIPLALVLGLLLAAVAAAAQVPTVRPDAALPADTLRGSAIQQLRLDERRLVVTIEQGTVALPDGLYRGDDGAQFTVRDGRIAEVRPAAAPPARRAVPRQPVRRAPARGTAVTAADVQDDRLLLTTADGRTIALADGTYASEEGISLDIRDGRGTAQNDYFSHERLWAVDGERVLGSWYRLPTGPWDWQHHGSIKRHRPTGAWIRQHLLARAGPYVGPEERSGWTR